MEAYSTKPSWPSAPKGCRQPEPRREALPKKRTNLGKRQRVILLARPGHTTYSR